ncbi:MAG: anti-sigma factor antagonist [Phycisphaerales bacterium]|nr:MAG: anti-sigma factor antagonist [Phycisphaerales bacterium]
MALNNWSESITIAELNDEPSFSEDMELLIREVDEPESTPDVIVDMKAVTYVSSSNLAQLLRLRKKLDSRGRRLRICAVNDKVWSVLITTGLDAVFEFTDDVTTSLASLQIEH